MKKFAETVYSLLAKELLTSKKDFVQTEPLAQKLGITPNVLWALLTRYSLAGSISFAGSKEIVLEDRSKIQKDVKVEAATQKKHTRAQLREKILRMGTGSFNREDLRVHMIGSTFRTAMMDFVREGFLTRIQPGLWKVKRQRKTSHLN